MVGKEFIEKWAGVPTEVHVASEFVYNMPLLSEKPLFIYISQSGETADSRAVLVETNKLGHKSLQLLMLLVQHYHVKRIIHYFTCWT